MHASVSEKPNTASSTKAGCMTARLVAYPLENNCSCCLQGLHNNNIFGSTKQITIFQIFLSINNNKRLLTAI